MEDHERHVDLGEDEDDASWAAAVTFVTGTVAAHQRYQARARTGKPDPFTVDGYS